MVNDGLGSVRGVAANDLSVLESRLLAPYGNQISGGGSCLFWSFLARGYWRRGGISNCHRQGVTKKRR